MGGIILKIHRLTATFGRLNNQTLTLGDGLNILKAPNETGKSTWCAFLTAMFYGINSRERDKAGFIAEKNRYAPWSGAAMQGRMECTADHQELTLLRETKRQTAPMGAFRAVYTGTGDEVPGLTGAACGEALLGVPREVFERSAFIRQAGLGITADPELERRIVSLITSGEEDTSYTEAAAALKRQLTRRRFNRRGEIPAAETELETVRRQLDALREHQRELSALSGEMEALRLRQDELQAQLTQWQQYLASQRLCRLQEARDAAEQAQQEALQLRGTLQAERVPENETIGRLRGAIVNLETLRRSVAKARGERDEAMKALLKAESAVNASPFAGQTADSARKDAAQAPPKRRPSPILLLLGIVWLAGAGLEAFFPQLLPVSNQVFFWAFWVCMALLLFAAQFLLARRRFSAWQAALAKRFGTSDQTEIAALADTYIKLLDARDAAQADVNAKSAAADSLYATLSSNEQAILLEVRRFAPGAFDIPTADRLLRESAVRRKALTDSETAAKAARTRLEILTQQQADQPVPEDGAAVSQPPDGSQEEISGLLSALQSRQSALQSRMDQLTGQITAIGDPAVLSAREEQLTARIRTLSGEYDAIAMALEALDAANTGLQNRFSPALGRRAAEIFGQLTDGRYTGVVLDRAFHLSAEPAGDSVYRDAQLLSAGAADQLYLAVRLAICELVLPPDRAVPLILDDALANYDDARCAAALGWLRREAENRQILLFTCHTREAEFFRNDPAVRIQVLTAPEEGV